MEKVSSYEHDISAINTVSDRLRDDVARCGTWTDYLGRAFDDIDDVLSYGTFVNRLSELRSELVKPTIDTPRGWLTLAWLDVRDTLSAESLRHGYLFGMIVNDELFVHHGQVARATLDRLAPHIHEIFDDIQSTHGAHNDIVWTLRLFGENLYQNTLAHPDTPNYHTIRDNVDPIKHLVNDICDELYPVPQDIDDFLGYERRDNDTTNFHHGFAIARRAYNSYLLKSHLTDTDY